MAVINGSKMLLLLDGKVIGATKSCTLTINNATADGTNKDSGGWEDPILAGRSWEVTFDGLYDPAGSYNFEYLFDEIYERDESLIAEIAQVDGTGGGEVYRGTVLTTSVSLTANMEDLVTYSGSFKGKGQIYKSTVATS